MKTAVLIVALVASFIALFPLSLRLADPFFTYPFRKDWRHAVLLICPTTLRHDGSMMFPKCLRARRMRLIRLTLQRTAKLGLKSNWENCIHPAGTHRG